VLAAIHRPPKAYERLPVEAAAPSSSSFLARNEFLLRRLHSLSGVIPVGAYMVVHLLVNARVGDTPAAYQASVYQIHSLGKLLPLVEWVFIFIPILFHAIYGVLILRTSLPNSSTYRYSTNVRYTLQRATGLIAFAFIAWHVFHMHGWLHTDWWTHGVAQRLYGHMFKPFNATSTAAEAIQLSAIVPLLYAIGVLACVFHLANGIWTFGITWGLWVTPKSQRRADWFCLGFGVVLGLVGLSALGSLATMSKDDIQNARAIEDKMYRAKVASGELADTPHKRAALKDPDKNRILDALPKDEQPLSPAADDSAQVDR
jgi:succinate dehydrogenase / fumarate reductase, cytochrome b subunit